MSMVKTGSIILLAVTLLLLGTVAAGAQSTTHTLSVDTTSHLVSSEWLPVGDVDGHVIGLQKREGTAICNTGESAVYQNILTLDFWRGKGGTATGYSTFTFKDGSTLLFSWETTITVENGLFSKQGAGKIMSGTGRFAGVTGTAVFTGQQLQPAALDSMLTATTRYIINYTMHN